ncbi:hypothetical protein EAG18_04140 [Pseudoalteromonas sp. J010]|uniref:hypothetical protein n=1 Tax=Pseudoalteromonas sp. J010 TaxID=998465 RepID=UPI000F64AB39|nr:hypothetical protein [Pseudoalteromonas sp. J010]RRS09881.1 hypothetical protein EAG18_04140 [Pseudoalteromonas sp. J010]
MKYVFTICIVLGLSACSTTTSVVKSGEEVAQNEVQSRDKLYCEQDIITGSRFTKRRCRTAEQKAAAEQEAKEMLRRRASSVGTQ